MIKIHYLCSLMRKVLTIIMLLSAATTMAVRAQLPLDMMEHSDLIPMQGSVDLDENGNPIEPPADSVKKVKARRPLESYFFADSTLRAQKYFSWRTSLRANRIEMVPIDTTAQSVQPNHPFTMREVAWQGNLGGAVFPLAYAERPDYRDFKFAQGFDAYNIFPEEALFYNVKTPLTFFSYYMSGQSSRFEEGFNIMHAQNISPSSGFNIDYRSQGTRGFYNWSKGRDKNLSMAFSHTGRKYTVHAGYIYNTANNKENGGIVNDRFITDTIFELAEAVPVKLLDARNVLKGNTAYLVQSYGFPLRRLTDEDHSIADYSTIFVGHSVEWSRWAKTYSDTHPNTVYKQLAGTGDWDDTYDVEFYDDWLINPNMTFDSIAETRVANRVFVQIQPYDRGGVVGLIDAGAGVDDHRYYMFHPRDYLTGRHNTEKRTDYYVDGAISGSVSRYFDWGADLLYHPMGDRRGDVEVGARAALSAFVREQPVTLSGTFRMQRREPTYWDQNLYSNHFAWSNDFGKETTTRLNVTLSIPSWALEMGATQSVVTGKVYYGADARPAQESSAVSVTGLYVDKKLRLGGWSFNHRVLLQESSNQQAIPVPLASAYLSYGFEFDVVKDVLRARIGLDGHYNTPYYAFGWMPATARFYNQREKEIGGYPLVDAFVSAKWKRMRLLLKMEHVNENLFGQRNYFTLLHYPLHKRIFKFGFTWAFYD